MTIIQIDPRPQMTLKDRGERLLLRWEAFFEELAKERYNLAVLELDFAASHEHEEERYMPTLAREVCASSAELRQVKNMISDVNKDILSLVL